MHRGFAIITTADHVYELCKLNHVEFKGRLFVVETVKTRSTHQNQATQNKTNKEFFPSVEKEYSPFLG